MIPRPWRAARPVPAILALLVSMMIRSEGAVSPTRPGGAPPRVLAFYYTWYGTPAVSGSWVHWNEGSHDPNRRTPAGHLDIGATDHPPILYDSNDPATIRRHLAEARRAGIDVLIATWWGIGDWHDRAFARVVAEAEADLIHIRNGPDRTPRPVSVTVYYERVPDNTDDAVAATTAELIHLLRMYGGSPAFFRHDGKPVIFIYGRAVGQLRPEQWRDVAARVKALQPVLLVGDGTDPALYDVFDALHEYNPVGAVLDGSATGARARRLVEEARRRGRTAMVTVLPGYDDGNIGRASVIAAPREKSLLYQRLWSAALDARPDWVMITSFNEWHEGSEIEPSTEYGSRYLQLTAAYAKMLRTGRAIVERGTTPRPKGWKIEPITGSRFEMENLPDGAIRIHNRSGTTGRFRASLPDGEEPYLLETGRSGAPGNPEAGSETNNGSFWRVLAPDRSDDASRSSFAYSMPDGVTAEMWEGRAFARSYPGHPFAGMTRQGLRLDLASDWPSETAHRWRVYPGGAFPLHVTVRNTGKNATEALSIEAWSPDDWESSERKRLEPLEPGASVSATLNVRPAADTPIGEITPVFAEFRAGEASRLSSTEGDSPGAAPSPDETPLHFLNAIEMEPSRPVDVSFRFEPGGRIVCHLINRIPGRTLTGKVTLRPAEGRSIESSPAAFLLAESHSLEFIQRIPENEPPGLRRTTASIEIGGYRQAASAIDQATIGLGPTDVTGGLRRIEVEDGRSEAAPDTDPPSRRAIPAPSSVSHYLYFDVPDGLPADGDTHILVEARAEAAGSLVLQYDSTDSRATLEGRYKDAEPKALSPSDGWRTVMWEIRDARFDNRQNGAADFRIAMGPETVLFRRVTVRKGFSESRRDGEDSRKAD